MTDTLEFEPEPSAFDHTAYIAHLPWRNGAFDQPYYRIYEWKKGWAFSRSDHPELGKFTGRTKKFQDALDACNEDFAKVARLHRWHEYMLANEPPGQL